MLGIDESLEKAILLFIGPGVCKSYEVCSLVIEGVGFIMSVKMLRRFRQLVLKIIKFIISGERRCSDIVSINQNTSGRAVKSTCWCHIKFWIRCHWRITNKLSKEYAEAKVEKEKNEAQKIAEEKYAIAAQSALIRQEELRRFFFLIDDIFDNDGLPMIAKRLKLAKLLEKYPELLAQLNKTKDFMIPNLNGEKKANNETKKLCDLER